MTLKQNNFKDIFNALNLYRTKDFHSMAKLVTQSVIKNRISVRLSEKSFASSLFPYEIDVRISHSLLASTCVASSHSSISRDLSYWIHGLMY